MASIWTKIITLFRGAAHEAGTAVVDANAMRILDQEVRDAQNALVRSREDLAKIMAQRKITADKVGDKQAKQAEYTNYIREALSRNNRELAQEVATKLAQLEADIAQETKIIGEYDASISKLQASARQAETVISRLKQQIDTVKATESVQRAQAALAAAHVGTGAKLGTALDSLERIKQRQTERAAQLEVAQELADTSGDGDLHRRLAQAGIMPGESSADSILARFEREQRPALGHEAGPSPVLPKPN
ncbi:PspA/IM30 family protein [Tahibacter amnicola]|uniref:PspA/IM30 family protein n=1 Tax=Tahibacter amnicola TaxID=2976241 RepID=A0ABY6BHK1_9GAMM|nr:PspA/IM30 family protein [Tahibacter amnicola]UXI67332.1 PspA/IM30 family protein [Tahibacter amnicola]